MDAKQVVREFHRRAWSAGDLEGARALLAEDLVDHDALAFPGRAPGADGLLQLIAMIRGALPDLERTIEDQVAENGRVVTRFVDRGTHRGELLGAPASGRRVAVRGVNIETVRNGRIAEVWHIEDLLGLLQQIGAAPA